MVCVESYRVRHGCRMVGSEHSEFVLGLRRTETGACASYGLHTFAKCYISGFYSASNKLVVDADLTAAELSIRKHGSSSKISLCGGGLPT